MKAAGPKARRWRRYVVAGALVAALGLLLFLGVSAAGQWLVVADPLAPAQAIVVLSGHVPFRAMEAGELHRAGWAAEVWLTRSSNPAEEAAMAALGLAMTLGDNSINRAVLERLGVPTAAIRLLGPGVRNTPEELRLVELEMARTGAGRVILVTSKPHSRRVRATWHALVGTTRQAVVRHAASDPFQGRGWWRRTGDALAVSRELFGLLNVWAGFPVRPDSAPASDAQPRAPR